MKTERDNREAKEHEEARLRRLEEEERVRLDNESRARIAKIKACYGLDILLEDEVEIELDPTIPYRPMLDDDTDDPIEDEIPMDLGPSLPYHPDTDSDTDNPAISVYSQVPPIHDGSQDLFIESRYNFKV